MKEPLVYLVEDDDKLRAATAQSLELAGFSIRCFTRAEPALKALAAGEAGAIVSDIRMPGMDGLQFLVAVRNIDSELPVILVTGHGDVPMAVGALKDGAFDFLTKPFAVGHLSLTVQRALEHRALITENRRLRDVVDATDAMTLVGESEVMARVRFQVRQLAEADVDVLITGETGTGKELVARLLHRQGRRHRRPFVTVDCHNLEADAAMTLFGKVGGGLNATQTGRIRSANFGTLLFDGIEALPLSIQSHLLRVIEEREVLAVGADEAEPLNLKIVATTSVDLEQAIARGLFRADLYYRLALSRIVLPPLRERGRDALLLYALFAHEVAAQIGLPDQSASDVKRIYLLTHSWPGNVRELRNHAYETVLSGGEDVSADIERRDLRSLVARFEQTIICDALDQSGGRITEALGRLGIPRKTLYDKLGRYNISPAIFRRR